MGSFSDETLMAFADGELDPATAARVEEALNADPVLAGKVAGFMQSRAAVAHTLKPLRDEPVPPKLEASVRAMVEQARRDQAGDGNVVAFASRKPASARPILTRLALPVAASLAIAVAAAAGYLAGLGGAGGGASAGLQVAGLDSPELKAALESVASGEEIAMQGSGDRFRAIATFRDDAGALCREFEVDTSTSTTVISVACRPETGWNVNFAVVAPSADTGYAPASSTESLDAYLAAIGAGAPIPPEEEAEALSALR